MLRNLGIEAMVKEKLRHRSVSQSAKGRSRQPESDLSRSSDRRAGFEPSQYVVTSVGSFLQLEDEDRNE
jgi:hypothetical protein